VSLLDREIDAHFDRSRYSNSLTYVDETEDGTVRHEVEFVVTNDPGGVGVVFIYDLKRPLTTRHRVSSGTTRLSSWTITEETGPASCDQIVLDLASLPANGETVKVVYDYLGVPPGEYFGRRTEISLDEESDPLVFRTTGDETLWHIAGRRDTYDDPSMWWAAVDANNGLNGVFQAMMHPIKSGVDLDIPTESEVLLQLEGLFEL